MIELDVMYINGIEYYKVPNGTGSTYKPIPKEFEPYFNKLREENKLLKSGFEATRYYLRNEIQEGRPEENLWEMGCYDEDKLILEMLDKLGDKLDELAGDK